MIVEDDAVRAVERALGINAGSVRADRHASGAREEEGAAPAGPTSSPVDGEALGRSRCGPASELHLAADGHGLPKAHPARRRTGRGPPAAAVTRGPRGGGSRRTRALSAAPGAGPS